MQDLTPAEVHLWYLDPDSTAYDALVETFVRVLSASEQSQYRRFHFPADARRYLVSHAMVRYVLSRYAEIMPAEWHFSATDRGKPLITNPGLESLKFNLTHTQGLAACVVSLDRNCGIDAEHLQARHNPVSVAKRMFSPVEYTALNKLKDTEQLDYFYRHWTLREAYVKAKGVGLSFPTNKIEFSVHSNTDIKLGFDASIKDQNENWMLRLWQIGAEHILAVAVAPQKQVVTESILREFYFNP